MPKKQMSYVISATELINIDKLIQVITNTRTSITEKNLVYESRQAISIGELFEDLGNRCLDISCRISAKARQGMCQKKRQTEL